MLGVGRLAGSGQAFILFPGQRRVTSASQPYDKEYIAPKLLKAHVLLDYTISK